MDLRKEFDELKEEIKELKALIRADKITTVLEEDNPLDIHDVANLLNLTKPTIYGYVQRNEIPHYKRGNRLYFFKTEILEWLKRAKVKTLEELSIEADNYLLRKRTKNEKTKLIDWHELNNCSVRLKNALIGHYERSMLVNNETIYVEDITGRNLRKVKDIGKKSWLEFFELRRKLN